MGFFGVCVLWRGHSVADVTAIRALGGDTDAEFEGAHGWRVVKLHHAEHPSAEQVSAAAAETGDLVLMAYVLDSDFAEVQYAKPGHSGGRFVLKPELAEEYGCPVDPAEQATAPAELVRLAGPGADERRLRAATAGRMLFAEDSVMWLAAGLGVFPLTELERHCFGDLADEPDVRRAMGR